jgi:hypothetical protein
MSIAPDALANCIDWTGSDEGGLATRRGAGAINFVPTSQ